MVDNSEHTELAELQAKAARLEYLLSQARESLKISQQRYDIAVSFSDVSIFDYDIKTKHILTQQQDFETFGLLPIFENGVQDILHSGVITKRSYDNLRKLFREIDSGVKTASTIIYATDKNGAERTLELKMVTIFDENGNPTYAVGVRKDITSTISFRKEKEYGDLLSSNLTFIYEANVSQDKILRYDPHWAQEVGLSGVTTLTGILQLMCSRHIFPEDVEMFENRQSPKSVITAFENGERIITFEYRKWVTSYGYQWFEVRINMVQNDSTGDIYMRVYISNVNDKKLEEIELLRRAQHDLMTGFYNKVMVAEKVNEFLASADSANGIHAFFIIDLDYFKHVNDNFGHAFGDAVLSQISAKISSLFRNYDILGRIGGDEFVVFMRNVRDEQAIFARAREICDTVTENYVHNGTIQKVTVSVGIAIYGKHGTTYDELYRHSDAALYNAKKHGRSRFCMYRSGMHFTDSAISGMDSRQVTETKTFENHISDYVFRILYESQDKSQAINSVLELIGKHYHVSRVYVFENSDDGKYACNTFGWCDQGILAPMHPAAKISYSILGDYKSYFGDEGVFEVADCASLPQPLQSILAAKQIKSMVQFPILAKAHFVGFIGFDECQKSHIPNSKELNECRNIANILGVFITEMRAFEKIEAARAMALSVVNGLDSYAHVCNPDTYEILFSNEKTSRLSPTAKVGDCCYKAFYGLDQPCSFCSMQALKDSNKDKITNISYHAKTGQWLKVSASWVDWVDGVKGCLIDILDVSDLKNG